MKSLYIFSILSLALSGSFAYGDSYFGHADSNIEPAFAMKGSCVGYFHTKDENGQNGATKYCKGADCDGYTLYDIKERPVACTTDITCAQQAERSILKNVLKRDGSDIDATGKGYHSSDKTGAHTYRVEFDNDHGSRVQAWVTFSEGKVYSYTLTDIEDKDLPVKACAPKETAVDDTIIANTADADDTRKLEAVRQESAHIDQNNAPAAAIETSSVH